MSNDHIFVCDIIFLDNENKTKLSLGIKLNQDNSLDYLNETWTPINDLNLDYNEEYSYIENRLKNLNENEITILRLLNIDETYCWYDKQVSFTRIKQ